LGHKSAWKAEKLGYNHVKVFAEGYPAWIKVPGNYPSVSEDWVKKQIEGNADMVLVDSRPKHKYDKGHVTTAISIPDSQFGKFKDQLPQDKAQTLVFYCGGLKCPLSHKSATKAIDLGYTDVKVFSAGYPAWKTVAGTSAATAVPTQVKAGKEEGSIDVGTFEKILKENPDSILLIDVRDPEEVAAGAFKTAVNIPSDKLEEEIKSLPSNKPIVFVCATGSRSGEAFYMVQDMRPDLKDVYYLEAEITYNKDGSYKIVEPK
jgi:rhodanese-related sulfurtransferase